MFNKLCAILAASIFFHSSWEYWYKSFKFVGRLALTRLLLCMLSTGFRLGLSQDIAMAIPILWLCCFETIVSPRALYALGHCPVERSNCDQALTFWPRIWDFASKFRHTVPYALFHQFCGVCQDQQQRNSPTT